LDNKPLEMEAELLIQHELIKGGFKVAKPTFDTEGADLLVVESITEKFTRFLKIQCKGRSSKASTNVTVNKSYVTDNFFLFLYLKLAERPPELFLFSREEILLWKDDGSNYVLYLAGRAVEGKIAECRFSPESVRRLHSALNKSPIKKYSSLVVDESFVQRAIAKTIESYSEIYPEMVFCRPSTDEVIRSVLSVYDNFQSTETDVKCHIFLSKEDCTCDESIMFSRVTTDQGVEVRIYREVAERDVHLEILEYLNRIINVENIMLVADDYVYEIPLNNMKARGVDIRIVQFGGSDGRQAFTQHRWADIIYAVAHAIGLSRHEW
jgi:hypothetical protein